MFRRIHSFRDPLHGFVRVSRVERDLIDCSVFQRLRRIHQLGTGYLVYHGAEHSRFGHSLGVMEIATRVFRAINEKRSGLLGKGDDLRRNEQLLRLAALLHDLGHPPFSHAADELFSEEPGTGKKRQHEDYTQVLIAQSEIREIIDTNFAPLEISAETVVDLFRDPAQLGKVGILLQDIVAGELDADRMDYLARDSLLAGVTYGRYDLERLLDTVTAIEDKEGVHLAVEDGGFYALEAFLLARYYMFLQVYLHEDRRFYDVALSRVLKELLRIEGGTYPQPTDWQKFLRLDDIWVLAQVEELAREGNEWAQALRDRRHWKVLASMDERDVHVDQVAWTHAQRDVLEKFGERDAVVDDARAKAFQRTDPGPYITGQTEAAERPKIVVLDPLDPLGKTAYRVEDRSDIVNNLGRHRVRIMRIYARRDAFADVLSFWTDALARHT